MKHHASPKFWSCLRSLPKPVQTLARKNFKLLKSDPRHPSLQFKKIGEFHSVRVGLAYRALAVDGPDGPIWFWIGSHSDYDELTS